MTRLRLLRRGGGMTFSYDGAPAEAPADLVTWFDVPGRASASTPIICGHWAALGLFLRPDLVALDSGCVWGRELTGIRLEDRKVYQVPCRK